MSTPLRRLLAQFRESSRSEREKGTYFERLAVAFMKQPKRGGHRRGAPAHHRAPR